MSAYWVARSKINDPVEYKKYTDLVPAIIAKFGGKVLARGGRFQIMEGPAKFSRFIVIEFPTLEQGAACFTSPECRGLVVFRRCEAGGALLQGRKFDHDEAAEFGGALHDLETPAARQHLAAELGDDGGHQVGVFLVLDGIVDFRTRNPISRHRSLLDSVVVLTETDVGLSHQHRS